MSVNFAYKIETMDLIIVPLTRLNSKIRQTSNYLNADNDQCESDSSINNTSEDNYDESEEEYGCENMNEIKSNVSADKSEAAIQRNYKQGMQNKNKKKLG